MILKFGGAVVSINNRMWFIGLNGFQLRNNDDHLGSVCHAPGTPQSTPYTYDQFSQQQHEEGNIITPILEMGKLRRQLDQVTCPRWLLVEGKAMI